MIELKETTKKYKKITALDNINLKLNKGEIFGYIGPNGAGKTTTLRILAGLISSFSGNYFFGNSEFKKKKTELLNSIGFMPQSPDFQDWRTPESALFTFAELNGLDKSAIPRRIDEVLELLGLMKYKTQKVKTLSGGTKQKIGFAQSILHKPGFLILDEPLSGLDPSSRIKFKSIIKEMSAKGTTVIFSSHILSDVEDIADRIGILSNGKLLTVGSLGDLKKTMAGESVIHFEFSGSFEIAVPEELKQQVKKMELTHHGLKLFFDNFSNTDEILNRFLRFFIENGVKLHSARPVEPNLDTLYQRYTEGSV